MNANQPANVSEECLRRRLQKIVDAFLKDATPEQRRRLLEKENAVTAAFHRLADGKTIVPDHGATIRHIRAERDPDRMRRPLPNLIDGIRFDVSTTPDFESIGNKHIHASIMITAHGAALKPFSFSFIETIYFNTEKVFVSLDSLAASAGCKDDLKRKIEEVCSTFIARKYVLLIAGGDSTYSFRIALKCNSESGTDAVEVPTEALRSLHKRAVVKSP